MAVRSMLIANPTNANITTNAKTALANSVTALSFDDAALANGLTDLAVFLAAGCAVLRNDSGVEEQLKQQAGYLLYYEEYSA